MLTARVKTGIVVVNSVALIAVVKDNPLTNKSWFRTMPSKLETVSQAKTFFGRGRSADNLRCSNAKMIAAPQMRNPTRLTLETDLNAILPKMGHVPNIT
jgi:hypothetical protein